MARAPLGRFIDRYTIEYVRTYPHPIERVWAAISGPAQMSAWFAPITFEPRLGGAYRALWEGEDTMFQGVITAFEPPRLLRFGGPHPGADAMWQFRLEPAEGGTRLTFTQCIPPGHDTLAHWPLDPPESPPDTPWRPGTLSGWHEALDALGQTLGGRTFDHPSPDESPLIEAYRELMRTQMPRRRPSPAAAAPSGDAEAARCSFVGCSRIMAARIAQATARLTSGQPW